MSEQFDAGLRDLYAAAQMAHDTHPGLAVHSMVARTRRRRRVRATAVTMATAAAVVGVAVAGTAVVNNLDVRPAPPADSPTESPTPDVEATPEVETIGSGADLACGSAVADLRVLAAPPATVVTDLARDDYSVNAPLTLVGDPSLAPTGDASDVALPGGSEGATYTFAVVSGGIVVATTEANPDAPLQLRLAPCTPGDGALAPGEYELYGTTPILVGDVSASLLGGPWPFTVTEAEPLQPADAHAVEDGSSDIPPTDPTAPLPDGDYLGIVSDVDAAAGTVTANLVVQYFGPAAEAWIAANAPGTEYLDDYVRDDPDGPTERTLPLGDAPVWEYCSSGSLKLVERTGGVDEWTTAPIEGGESLCEDTSTLPRAGLYWLDVRGGMVAQVVAQWVP